MILRRFYSILVVICLLFTLSNISRDSAKAKSIQKELSLSSAQELIQTQSGFFTENKGQWDKEILFVGNTSFGRIAFTKDAVYYQLIKAETAVSSVDLQTPMDRIEQDRNRKAESQVIKLSFVNGKTPQIKGENLLPHYHNYFIGNDASKWTSYCRNYTRVYYEDIWAGIDLAYFFTPEGMKYEYYVEPKADMQQLQIQVEGAELTNLGNSLEIASVLGKIQDTELLVFDQVTQSPLHASFSLHGDTYSFQGIPEIRVNTVVIDPLVYSTYLSGIDFDLIYSIKIDALGNAYVAGFTNSADFQVTPGSYMTSLAGAYDGFVTKINPTGTALLYSTYLGGHSDDIGSNVAIDASGNAYIAGYTNSTSFPVTPGAFMTTHGGGWYSGFVTKINPTGTALLYSTYLGGSAFDTIKGLMVDSTGNAYVAGYTQSIDYPVTPGAFKTSLNNVFDDGFVTKINPTGSALLYSTYLGGSDNDYINCLTIDASGNAYVAGYAHSADYPVTPGAFMTSHGGGWNDGFVTKINPTGSALLYSTYLGGSDDETISSISVDTFGNAYITGWAHSADYPVTPGAFMTTHGGGWDDGFVTKLNPTGTALLYSTYLGGTNNDFFNCITVDASGNAYVGGYTGSSDFPVTPGAYSTSYSNGMDAFLTKINRTGSALLYSTYLGGTNVDDIYSLTLDSVNNAYVAGYTTSGDYPVTPGAFMTTLNGFVDGIVTKLSIVDVALTGVLDFNEVNLQWTLINQGNEAITKYQLFRADVADGVYQLLSTVLGSGNISYTDSTGEPGKTYSYYVVALYMNDLPAAESNRVIVGPIQSVIVTLTGSVQYNESHLNWITQNPVGVPIFGYRIYRGIPDAFLYVIDFVPGDLIHSYIDKNVEIGKYYVYAVEAMASNDLPLAFSNQLLLGPIQALPDPILDLSIELNKHEFCYGDDVLYKVTVHNTSAGLATITKLQITLPREIQYVSADKYRGEVQSGGIILFNLGTIHGQSSVTFQINATVSVRTSVMKSAATFFFVSCLEEVFAETVVYTTFKSCDGGNPIPYIRLALLNTLFDPETGERYINKDSEVSMDISIDGFTAPYRYEVIWGDGEKTILEDQTEKKLNFTHRYTSGGSMEIQVNVTDTSGKSRTVSARIKIK